MEKQFDTKFQRTDRATFERVERILKTAGNASGEALEKEFATGVPANAYTINGDGAIVTYLSAAHAAGNGRAMGYLVGINYKDLCASSFDFSAYMQSPQVLKALIDHGHSFKDVAEKNSHFLTGAYSLDVDYLRKARELGANFDCQHPSGDLLVPVVTMYAMHKLGSSMVEKLLAAGASPETRGTNGMSVLHGAVTEGKAKPDQFLDAIRSTERFDVAVRAVAAAGGSLDMVDDEGRSALHLACKLGYVNKARLLIEAGADLQLKDKNGKTPEDLARRARRASVLDLCAAARARSAVLGVVERAAGAAKLRSAA